MKKKRSKGEVQAQKDQIEEIRRLIATDDIALEEALLAIYEFQTELEKENGVTLEDNKVGFSGTDATFMTKMAQWVLNDKVNRPGERLSHERRRWTRVRMRKYAKQLERTGWFFVDARLVEQASVVAAETPRNGESSESRDIRTPERFSSRTDALEAAIERAETGREYLRSIPLENTDQIRKAKERLRIIEVWIRTLVLEAGYQDLRTEKFLTMARFARPCRACNGSCQRNNGKCFRCRGKGFQTQTDIDRNIRYDKAHAGPSRESARNFSTPAGAR